MYTPNTPNHNKISLNRRLILLLSLICVATFSMAQRAILPLNDNCFVVESKLVMVFWDNSLYFSARFRRSSRSFTRFSSRASFAVRLSSSCFDPPFIFSVLSPILSHPVAGHAPSPFAFG